MDVQVDHAAKQIVSVAVIRMTSLFSFMSKKLFDFEGRAGNSGRLLYKTKKVWNLIKWNLKMLSIGNEGRTITTEEINVN
jgi:hypothetical protein